LSKIWKEQFHSAIAALLATNNDAIIYFTHRDLLGRVVDPIEVVCELAEPRKILRKQNADGSWTGSYKKTPVYPVNHTHLVATFKAFRALVERYQFTRESASIEKAAEYLLTFQTPEGDIRGFIGNQYATYYTGYVLSLLIRAGYADDPRVEKGMKWLFKMRQNDGGWTIPILTHHLDGKTMYRLTSSYTEPVEPNRSQPFSHNWTDMVLRAFAVHPVYCHSEEARIAGELLKSRFFQPDVYSSYKAASYWTRFIGWWANLLTAMESLSLLGFTADDPDIYRSLQWFFDNMKDDSFWECSYSGKEVKQSKGYYLERIWISLRICRVLKRFLEQDLIKSGT
jgi:hypothetical protein